jgi:hypothetical protein
VTACETCKGQGLIPYCQGCGAFPECPTCGEHHDVRLWTLPVEEGGCDGGEDERKYHDPCQHGVPHPFHCDDCERLYDETHPDPDRGWQNQGRSQKQIEAQHDISVYLFVIGFVLLVLLSAWAIFKETH